ncbi:hypothetical protein yc1106_07677 [Curvularia clavata]|uniref:Helicase ATP-binding domain-containing protein n=1 Tax=Curvularia clavata TaxID=95742 RepID=A0A9Q8ZHV5_CURCL|nr:hypothetical protein yc1106_07677 [Curvularia clavata]
MLLRDVLLLNVDETGRIRKGGATIPELSLETLMDRLGELSAGYSFLKEPGNAFSDWEHWLLKRWCGGGVAAYMKRVRRFKEALFVLVHLSAGAPARGTEITSILCKNEQNGYSFSKKIKTIYRYVAREDDKSEEEDYVDDENENESTYNNNSSASGEESEHERPRPRHVPPKPRLANLEGTWGTDRIHRVLRQYTYDYMDAKIRTREWRHAYPAIYRDQDDAQALQSGHTRQIEEINYRRSTLESPFHTVAERERFRREQSLAAIVNRRLCVLVVMGTGSGKSTLFMLLAALSLGGVTVVIAPLNALRQDLQDRCDRLGIRCATWCGTDPPYDASIVLATPESVASSLFSRFLNQKRMLCQLDQIVIDECHVLLDSTATWRPAVLELCDITKKNTQVVYLTATLPPTLQPAFLQVAELQGQPLEVMDYESATRDETLKRLVATKQQEFGPDAQIIVYCLTVPLIVEIANLLSCAAYYSAMGTEEEKADRDLDLMRLGFVSSFT